MYEAPPPTKPTAEAPGAGSKPVKSRRGPERKEAWSEAGDGHIVIGIDPGSRNTAIVVRDGEVVLLASTIVREGDQHAVEYALTVVDYIRTVLAQYPDTTPVGLEDIKDPKGFHKGKRAPINPKDIVRTGIVVGAIAATWRERIIMIPPGGNGSQDISQYPSVLKGRRPKDLSGTSTNAGTRRHEQSAFDVAGKVALEAPQQPSENKE